MTGHRRDLLHDLQLYYTYIKLSAAITAALSSPLAGLPSQKNISTYLARVTILVNSE